LVTVRTVIKLSYVPWWWGYTEPVSPRPPHLHRISTIKRLADRVSRAAGLHP